MARWPSTSSPFLARVAVAQSSSLNLFANRDVELEQRAMLLKRLAFAIFSSEIDQYQKYLPDIQGKELKHFIFSLWNYRDLGVHLFWF